MLKSKLASFIPVPMRDSLYTIRQQMAIWVAGSDETVRRRGERLRALKGAYAGQRGFIMGNGPSLNKMDLSLLEGERVWGSNRCYLLFERVKWRPAFYTAVDKRVVPDNREQINMLASQLPETKFFYPVAFRAQGILDSAPNVFWYNEEPVQVDMGKLPEGTFSTEADKYVQAVFSVTIASLQLAVYLGFNPIYLIGCDTSYSRAKNVKVEGDQEKLVATSDDDSDHFDPSYFGQGKRFHEPHVARMIFQYHEASLICKAMGVKVYNATVGGNLEEFDRVSYTDLF